MEEALACWATALALFEAVELRSLAGWGGDEAVWAAGWGTDEDELFCSELLLGLCVWLRLFPEGFRFEPTRLRKREGIGSAPLHMARSAKKAGRAGR